MPAHFATQHLDSQTMPGATCCRGCDHITASDAMHNVWDEESWRLRQIKTGHGRTAFVVSSGLEVVAVPISGLGHGQSVKPSVLRWAPSSRVTGCLIEAEQYWSLFTGVSTRTQESRGATGEWGHLAGCPLPRTDPRWGSRRARTACQFWGHPRPADSRALGSPMAALASRHTSP